MDVKCANCREPWDTFHIRHDEIYDTDLSLQECERVKSGEISFNSKMVQEALKRKGWRFGGSYAAILICPCCPKDATGKVEIQEGARGRMESRMTIGHLLAGDDDGVASMVEDLDIMDDRAERRTGEA